MSFREILLNIFLADTRGITSLNLNYHPFVRKYSTLRYHFQTNSIHRIPLFYGGGNTLILKYLALFLKIKIIFTR